MIEAAFSKGAAAEKRELLILSLGSSLIALALALLVQARFVPAVLMVVAVSAALGFLWYNAIGRNVYLVLALVAATLGRVVSWLVMGVMYVVVVAIFGSILCLFGMNRLQRNFRKCKKRASMFMAAPVSDTDSFRRQS